MSRYSAFSLFRHGLSGHQKWDQAWRSPEPKKSYDMIIIGGGGHGLATAYYLAKNHGMTNIAVIEKSWLGGGNTGRNTTIIRSNYLQPQSIAIYDLAHSLYKDLTQDLNFNIMFSQRGLLNLCLTRHEYKTFGRIAEANKIYGVESSMLSAKEVLDMVPILNGGPEARYPVFGALYQKSGGVARHDAVAWGYARGADQMGVDIIENCTVKQITTSKGKVTGIETSKGTIKTKKVGVVVAGATSLVMETAGVKMPLESVTLQACVSEPIKPLLDIVVMAGAVHGYVSQSDRGELVIGGSADPYINYTRRGGFAAIEHTITALVELFPCISRLKMMRQWGGTVDMSPDRSPIIGQSPVKGLYVNCGWGTGGFKAIPGSGFVMADTMANDRPHPIAEPFGFERFAQGRLLDESAAAAVAH